VDEHAALVAEGLEKDDIYGGLAADEEGRAFPLPRFQVVPVDLVGRAQDVAVPGFDQAVPGAKGDPLVLGIEPGLPEEGKEIRGLGREAQARELPSTGLQGGEQGREPVACPDGLAAQGG
jgi:hypothetical protein